MAEATITTPVIILLMVVILNFGILVYTAQAAENAANQALIGEYSVQAVAPGGIAGLPRGDFTDDATAIFRQEGW